MGAGIVARGGVGTGPKPKPGHAAFVNVNPIPTVVRPMPTAQTGGGFQAGPAPGAAPPPINNTAENDPTVQDWLDSARQRFEGSKARPQDPLLQEQVDELRRRRSSDTTERATNRAESHILDRAAGQKSMLKGRVGGSGGRQAGVEAKLEGRIDDNAARAAAAAAADIQLGEEQRLDNLAIAGQGIMSAPGDRDLARDSMTNSLLATGLGAAQGAANLGLANRSLGLQQWQSGDASARGWQSLADAREAQKRGELMALLRMEEGGY